MKRMSLVLLFLICCSFIVNTVGLFAESLPERAITTFPHLQGFDSAAFPPPEWTNVKTAGLGEPGTWDRQTVGTNPTCLPYSGAGMARYNSADLIIGTRGELITPPLVIEDETVYKATFRMFRDDGYPDNYDRVYVHLNSSPTSAGGEQLLLVNRYYGLQPAVSVPNQWYEYSVLFSTETFASPVYLVFEGYSGNGAILGSNIYLDELTIAEATAPSFSSGLSNWNFGNVILGQTATKQITLTNTGDGPGVVHSVSATGTGFSVIDDPTPVEVQPGGSISFTVQFQPMQYTVHYGQVNYTCDLGYEYLIASYDINLTGTGYFPAINTFPWSEDFEGSVFPPPGWTAYDMDGLPPNWVLSNAQNHTPEGNNSALHPACTDPEGEDQNGWLVSPPIYIPPMGGGLSLSIWCYNANPDNYISNSLYVSTGSPNPAHGQFQQYQSIEAVYDEWTNNSFDTLWFYEYQTIHIAFRYYGLNADDWYLDDISIYAPDYEPPEITHLPLLNTPRTDIPYRVTAQISDDPGSSEPAQTAVLSYIVNGEVTEDIPMTFAEGIDFYADIPAQSLNSIIGYQIMAWDANNNIMSTDVISFAVEDPAWLRYDADWDIDYFGSSLSYAVYNLYENPFYGTGISLAVHMAEGMMFGNNTATLEIYDYDGFSQIDLIHSQPVSFMAEQRMTFDLTAHNLAVSRQYLLVGFSGIAPNNYFAADRSRDYGRSYQVIGTGFPELVEDMSWVMGVLVGAGSSALDAPSLQITRELMGDVELYWNYVDGASSYRVYGNENPYDDGNWMLLGITDELSYIVNAPGNCAFFRVVADSELPPVRTQSGMRVPIKN